MLWEGAESPTRQSRTSPTFVAHATGGGVCRGMRSLIRIQKHHFTLCAPLITPDYAPFPDALKNRANRLMAFQTRESKASHTCLRTAHKISPIIAGK